MKNKLAGYVLHSGNYYGNSPSGAGPLDGAGRLRPAAESGTKAPMRQPHETLRDRTHLSQAHTQYDELFTWCGKMIRLGKIR